jgi:hypothetical protein
LQNLRIINKEVTKAIKEVVQVKKLPLSEEKLVILLRSNRKVKKAIFFKRIIIAKILILKIRFNKKELYTLILIEIFKTFKILLTYILKELI